MFFIFAFCIHLTHVMINVLLFRECVAVADSVQDRSTDANGRYVLDTNDIEEELIATCSPYFVRFVFIFFSMLPL